MTQAASHTCDLCGLPLGRGRQDAVIGGKTMRFCCSGCKMVYSMLMEAADAPDPAGFRQTELYRRCVAAGVVPATADDLGRIREEAAASESFEPAGADDERFLSVHWAVSGMWCPACAWVIQAALERSDGVVEVRCDFATDRLRCRYDPARVAPSELARKVASLGYPLADGDGRGQGRMWRSAFVRLIICALLSANVMMLSWSLYSGFFTSLSQRDIRFISWPIVIMTTAVMAYGGGPLFRKAWWGLRARAPGMEALVCLGALSAYLFSLHHFMVGSFHLYFDTACMLITLVLLGKLLETRAKARVRQDLEGFLSLQPNKVRWCGGGFPRGRFVALDQLSPGDEFRVLAGEVVPADGEVVAGSGWVDASAITGESRLASAGTGHTVASGSRLVRGDLNIKASRVGPDALLGQMIAIIEKSLSRQTPLENRTDRWLALFVPVMVGLAVITAVAAHAMGFEWHLAFVRGLTVLVVACPCALGIAVPLARIAGISLAGRRGILVRDFEAFERSRRVDCAVMDKTGTLTRGRWAVASITLHGPWSEGEALSMAAGLEQGSEHVIARAVLDHARDLGIEAARVTDTVAEVNGVRGVYQGKDLKIGSPEFISPATPPEHASEETDSGLFSYVYMSLDGRLCASFGFGDELHPSALVLVRELGAAGIACHLVSGDARTTTRAVAQTVGIDPGNTRGGQLPHEKAEWVDQLQSGGARVVMVGDGINDAPALAGAHLSVAVHHDASLVQQAAAITLMRGDPSQLIDFLRLARRVNAKVAQNLGCALIYNLIGVPAAMAGLLNPLVAVTAMLLSSLTVIGNTLLLARKD